VKRLILVPLSVVLVAALPSSALANYTITHAMLGPNGEVARFT
jgi:hypothetical protein